MCNLSQGIYNDGKAEGRAEGAVSKAVDVVKNLLAKGFPLDEALSIAGIDEKTYEEFSSKDQ